MTQSFQLFRDYPLGKVSGSRDGETAYDAPWVSNYSEIIPSVRTRIVLLTLSWRTSFQLFRDYPLGKVTGPLRDFLGTFYWFPTIPRLSPR